MNNNQVYQENGFSNREEYLIDLADNYSVSIYEVCAIAEMLGENEDFDGLVSALEEYSFMF